MKRIPKILREIEYILIFLFVFFSLNYTIFSLTGEEDYIIWKSIIFSVVILAFTIIYGRFKRPK